MRVLVAYVAGVATGWIARSAFGSTREAAVQGLAAGLGAVERVRRLVATEREFMEDLLAEARSVYDSGRARVRRGTPKVVA